MKRPREVAMLRLVLLLLGGVALSGCGLRTGPALPEHSEVARLVWMPYSYRAAYDEDGVQIGWVLREFRLDMAPPSQLELDGGIVEIALEFETLRRERLMGMDWVPPDNLEEVDPVRAN